MILSIKIIIFFLRNENGMKTCSNIIALINIYNKFFYISNALYNQWFFVLNRNWFFHSQKRPFIKTGCDKSRSYTVEFYANDALVEKKTVKKGETVTYPEAPELRGYTFKGWDTEPAPVQGNLRINALYEIIRYRITYINDGSPADNPETYTVLDEVILKNPEKEGYAFIGWFLDGEKIVKIERGTVGDLTLTAMYEETLTMVEQDREELLEDYGDVLKGTVSVIDRLPLAGKVNQSKITWQSNSTAVSVNPETGEVTITRSAFPQEVTLYALIVKGNTAEMCLFHFTVPAI